MQLAVELSGLGEVPGDSAIYVPGEKIERVLIGIDLGGPELMLAEELGCDLAIAHHPPGGAGVLHFHEVLARHIDQMTAVGVPEEEARAGVEGWMEERRILDSIRNYDHAPSIARLLGIPYMNIHTPLDEIGRQKMTAAASELAPGKTVSDLIDLFYEKFGEFRNAETRIEARVGRAENRLGKVVVSHGAGTNGGYRVAKAYFEHGIDTLIYIHCSPQDSSRLKEEYGDEKNLIVTGHIASDSVGINPFISALREHGLTVIPFSGIIPA